jgi:hypothetical protein
MPETMEDKIARIKGSEREAAETEAKVLALQDEMTRQNCIYPQLADQMFAQDLKHLSVKDGKVIGARELVEAHRDEYPEAFRGRNANESGGTPPRPGPDRGLAGVSSPAIQSQIQGQDVRPRRRGMGDQMSGLRFRTPNTNKM